MSIVKIENTLNTSLRKIDQVARYLIIDDENTEIKDFLKAIRFIINLSKVLNRGNYVIIINLEV